MQKFCLITNNPRKIAGLKGYDLEMVDRVPLIIEATPYNSHYLETKAKKLGHFLLRTHLVTLAIHCAGDFATVPAKYRQFERVRALAHQQGLLAQEEVRSVAVALFGQGMLIVNLGLENPHKVESGWYAHPEHNYWASVAAVLDAIAEWPELEKLELLVANGHDPFTHLQVGLSRQSFSLGEPGQPPMRPSELSDRLQTQRIYIFTRRHPNG